MTPDLPLLVFSDLDGTLLDHDSYSHAPARPALDRLRESGAGVILATSKTAAEVAPLRSDLGLADWPAIVENGAGLLEARTDADDQTGHYPDIRQRLATLPEGFRGFGDMSDREVADITGLPVADARRARIRAFSEPGIWQGSEADLAGFLAAATRAGLHHRRGGRFLTFSLGGTKADRMQALIARYRPAVTLALGDAPNDTEMLEAADYGVIVANPHATPLPRLPGEGTGRITRTRQPGPHGWNQAVLERVEIIEKAAKGQAYG